MGSSFGDEVDCGNFFDQIDDLIEFPPENECGDCNLVNSEDCNDFSSIWSDTLPESDPLVGCHSDSAADLSTELSVPYEDILQLEWLSTFMEDSFSGEGMTMGKENLCLDKEPGIRKQFQTSSPVSVLESSSSSSSSCSIGKNAVFNAAHCGSQRARSKRPRPATFNPRAHLQLVSPSSSVETSRPFETAKLEQNFTEFMENEKVPKTEHKKKKPKPSFPVVDSVEKQSAQAIRKCLHCEITKTPQWRAGPMGPKTLCNACGVRYKSGRLFPEYRPAASPTFIPALHSNSHKKVAEMRTKVGLEISVTIPSLKCSPNKIKVEH